MPSDRQRRQSVRRLQAYIRDMDADIEANGTHTRDRETGEQVVRDQVARRSRTMIRLTDTLLALRVDMAGMDPREVEP